MSIDPDLLKTLSPKDADAIGEQIRAYFSMMVDQAMYLFENGTPDTQAQMIKAAMPALARQIQTEAESEALTDMRERQTALFVEVRASLTNPDIVDAEILPPTDTPTGFIAQSPTLVRKSNVKGTTERGRGTKLGA